MKITLIGLAMIVLAGCAEITWEPLDPPPFTPDPSLSPYEQQQQALRYRVYFDPSD
ncbi:MAG: hypothetical protein HQL56_11185 [Magnetococcales bacterium]|nr:hypothetical protein [Magnetococcales bacterium]